MKKLLSLTLVIAMLALSLFSCSTDGSGDDATSTSAPNETSAPALTDPPVTEPPVTEYVEPYSVPEAEMNYDGYQFSILTAGNVAFNDFDFQEDSGVVLDNAQYIRKTTVEQKLDIIIEQTKDENKSSFGNGPGFKRISNAVSANECIFDLGLIGTYDSTQLAVNQCLADFRSIKYIDLERSWWDQDANNDLSINGLLFLTTGDITVSNNNQTFTLIFNKTLAKETKIEDPYTLVKEGKWTYDKLQQMVKTVSEDINGDDIMDMRDKYGMIVWDDSVMAAVNSAGQRCCTIDSNGQITLTLNTEATVNVLNEWFEMTYDKNTAIYNQRHSANNATHGNAAKMWEEDRALFRNFLIENVHDLREIESDFGILPYPKLAEEQSRYYSTLAPYNGQFLCVPAVQNDMDMLGAVTEALAYYGKQIVRPAFYEKTLFGGVFRDEESKDMLDIMFNSYIYDFGWYCQIGEYNSVLIKMVRAYETDFVSKYTAKERAANVKVKNVNKEFDELAQKWGK